MNSLLKKRLPGFLAAGLVALAVGAAGAPASAAPVATTTGITVGGATTSGATTSGLTRNQRRARSIQLRRCNKRRPARRKIACRKQVIRKYQRISRRQTRPPAPTGKTYTVNLGDDFFAPNAVNLKVNDSINWSWAQVGGFEAHNVTLDNGPSGVKRNEFASQTTTAPSYRFKRTFKVPGTYNFVCSLHFSMTMTANVTR
jgi:plastocyanin